MNIEKIKEHYDHAREKHPYFYDLITGLSQSLVDAHLSACRAMLSEDSNVGAVEPGILMSCEFYEALQAYTRGNITHAVEECYDTIAVLLRMIDVLEGRRN